MHWNSTSCLRGSKQPRLRSFTTDWTDVFEMINDINPTLLHILTETSSIYLFFSFGSFTTVICHPQTVQTTNQPITVIGSWWFWTIDHLRILSTRHAFNLSTIWFCHSILRTLEHTWIYTLMLFREGVWGGFLCFEGNRDMYLRQCQGQDTH